MRGMYVAVIVAGVALSAAAFTHLPARVAVHWNANGAPNEFASRTVAACVVPAVMIALIALYAVIPRISPRGFEVEGSSRAYAAIALMILLFLLAVHVVIILTALRVAPSIGVIMPLLLGILFAVVGNYLPKMRRNFFIGIRTPWTLADEDVWYRTHRMGGVACVTAGVALMTIGPFVRGTALNVLLAAVVIALAVVPVVYSFAIYRAKGEPS